MTPEEAVKVLQADLDAGLFGATYTEALRVLLAERERLVQMMQRIAEDVLPDPVSYADITPEGTRDAFIRKHLADERELSARDHAESLFFWTNISVKWLEQENERLRAALKEVHGTEPSLNFKDGRPYEYCPLCDDQTWPCKVVLLLAQPEAEPKEER